MKKLAVVVVCGLILSSIGVFAANDPKEEAAVMATLEAMAKATVGKDVAALNKIYGEDLTYGHSSGATQTKAEVLEALKGPSTAEFMRFSNTKIRIYDDMALAKGVVDFRTVRGGNNNDNHMDILWVLVKRQGNWQVIVRQATRLSDPVVSPVAR